MDSTRIIHSIFPLTLALLLPACVIDTKLIDNPSTGGDDSTAAPSQTDTTAGATEVDPSATTGAPPSDTDTGVEEETSTTVAPGTGTGAETETDSGEPLPEECSQRASAFEWVIVSNSDGTWLDPVDEICTVISSAPEGSGLKFVLDCPQHAMTHGEFELTLLGGPIPLIVPQAGEQLDVYFRPLTDDFINTPHPELLFLRSEGELLYAAALGFFLDPNDEAAATEHQAPLAVTVEPGPCPLVDNPDGGDGDGFECQREAPGRLQVTTPDEAPVQLVEAEVGKHHVGTRAYTSHVRRARVGEDCVDIDLEKFAYSIALTEAP